MRWRRGPRWWSIPASLAGTATGAWWRRRSASRCHGWEKPYPAGRQPPCSCPSPAWRLPGRLGGRHRRTGRAAGGCHARTGLDGRDSPRGSSSSATGRSVPWSTCRASRAAGRGPGLRASRARPARRRLEAAARTAIAAPGPAAPSRGGRRRLPPLAAGRLRSPRAGGPSSSSRSATALVVIPAELVERKLTLAGSIGFDNELHQAVEVLAADPDRYRPLVSEAIVLDEAPGGWTSLSQLTAPRRRQGGGPPVSHESTAKSPRSQRLAAASPPTAPAGRVRDRWRASCRPTRPRSAGARGAIRAGGPRGAGGPLPGREPGAGRGGGRGRGGPVPGAAHQRQRRAVLPDRHGLPRARPGRGDR